MAAKAFAVFVNLQLLLLLTGLVAAGAIICTETFRGTCVCGAIERTSL